MFIVGNTYNRHELHQKYGGNPQSGISPCSKFPIVFIFTSPNGKKHGYQDKWISSSVFEYTGEGQYGNMDLHRGNLAIRNHKQQGRNLYLFKKVDSSEYEFLGQFEYLNHVFNVGPDTEKTNRRIIIFQLMKKDNQ